MVTAWSQLRVSQQLRAHLGKAGAHVWTLSTAPRAATGTTDRLAAEGEKGMDRRVGCGGHDHSP